MRLNRRALRDQLTKPNNEHLPDGIGGTITGGPMEPLGLVEILERGARGASRGGAVSGAAQIVAGGPRQSNKAERGISLSDGSRICFASIAEVSLYRDDDVPMARHAQTGAARDDEAPVPRWGKPRAKTNDRARTSDPHRTRVLAPV
ncbi:MAG TPA: hypothetical protein VHX39_18530 [Acetobacteraceae bacterium]|jgi:hypothetical protein|nr:hypothetical protein [Acetobacteraceae bacterium]